jgi:tetratricopeptide (TPR) repeat protein
MEPNAAADDHASPPSAPRASKHSPLRSIAVAVLALGAIGGSGAYIARELPDLLPQPAPAPAPVVSHPAPRRLVGDDPSKHSQFFLFGDQAGQATAIGLSRSGKVHGLDDVIKNYAVDPDQLASFQGLLTREIFRQAVLVAARDGLGLATRDGALGEPMPEAASTPFLDVAAPLRIDNFVVLQIRRGTGPESEALLTQKLVKVNRSHQFDQINLAKLVEAAELLSRTTVPEVLKQVGLAGKPHAWNDRAGVPDPVAKQLDRMAFIDQFAAVRTLHRAIADDGESSERLGALSRGYAHLGLLTGFQWNAMHKVYQARALLYAQRLLAHDPKSPEGLWHRAYAEALAGMHQHALNDLDAAQTRADDPARTDATRPDWVDLTDALCRFDTKSLSKQTGPRGELASLLALLTVEHTRARTATLNAGRAVIARNPECFFAHDAICAASGVASLHSATLAGPEILATIIPRKIAALPDAPEAVKNPETPEALTRALDEAATPKRDHGEPSWGALARNIRETRFIQVWRRLSFMRDLWNVPTNDYWREASPLVADHPLRPFLLSYVFGPTNPASGFPQLAATLDATDLNANAYGLFREAQTAFPENDYIMTYSLTRIHTDSVSREIALDAMYAAEKRLQAVDRLLRVSPYSPAVMAALIETQWGRSKGRLADWEKTAGDHPTYLAALARKYGELGRPDDAERYLVKYIKQSPDLWAVRQLADVYKAKGDLNQWRATLDAFLEQVEDNHLDHARVRVIIADELMKSHKYAEARSYADAAAASWAGWAMECAQRCAEAQHDWKAAEFWVRNMSERYPNSSWPNWLAFCLRTGQGDKAAATAWSRQVADAIIDRVPDNQLVPVAFVRLHDGNLVDAKNILKRVSESGIKDPMVDLMLALTADKAGDAETFEAALSQTKVHSPVKESNPYRLAVMFHESLAGETKGQLGLPTLDAWLQLTSDQGRGNVACLIAWFLTNHDRFDDAKGYWKLAAESSQTYFWLKVLAADTLRERYHETVPTDSDSAT